VAAVFSNPVDKLLGPLNGLSPAYGPKTVDLCNANDPICGGGEMDNMAAHHQYVPGRTIRPRHSSRVWCSCTPVSPRCAQLGNRSRC
jgi:hypothetical protein